MIYRKTDNNYFFWGLDCVLDGANYLMNQVLPDKEILKDCFEKIRDIKIDNKDELDNFNFLEIPTKYLYIRDKIQKYSLTNNFSLNKYQQIEYYRIYLFIILPNDIFLKLYRSTNDFNNWEVHTFEIFTFLLDLYANNILKNNDENNKIIENLSTTIINKYNFQSSIFINNDILHIGYKEFIIDFNIIANNLSNYDLKINIPHNDLYGDFMSSIIQNMN
jgi:hypothetical protein